MISGSAAFMTALDAKNRFWDLKVTITRNYTGAPELDISDRIISSDITQDYERRNGSASLEIDNYDFSLSPMNRDSTTNQISGGIYDPLLDSNHKIIISKGLLTTNGYEYIQRFVGYLGDEIDADSYPGIITVTARDKSKLFQDTFIVQSKSYAGTIPVENVMQDLINTFASGTTITVANATNFNLGSAGKPYRAGSISLWDALQQCADAADHELRFVEDDSLILRKNVRNLDTMTVVKTFHESEISRHSIQLSDSDVRNHIVVRAGNLKPVELKNQASIDKYGRRYAEARRQLTDMIATQAQASGCAVMLLEELSYINPTGDIELPLFPIVQVNDVIEVINNKLGTTSSDRFRVVRIKEGFTKDKKRTTISFKGYQTTSIISTPPPNPPTNIDYTINTRVIQNYSGSGFDGISKTVYWPTLSWTPPSFDVSGNALDADFGGYTIYRQQSGGGVTSGGVPFIYNTQAVASIPSYISSLGRQINYFHDYTASGGQTYYYSISAHNSAGAPSPNNVYSGEKIPITIPNNTLL